MVLRLSKGLRNPKVLDSEGLSELTQTTYLTSYGKRANEMRSTTPKAQFEDEVNEENVT